MAEGTIDGQPAADAATAPSQASAEPPVELAADDPGQQLRIQIDRLCGVLSSQPNGRALRTLTHSWPARQKARYRRRCTALIAALEALREALAPADLDNEDGDGTGPMAIVDDAFPNLEEISL